MASKRIPVAQVVRQAVGTQEAAGLMGVHFSAAVRMFDKGWVGGREMKGRGVQRRYIVFDGAECDANYREYEEKIAQRGGRNDRRPRAWLHTRHPTLRFLAEVETPIAFDDAIGVLEAAEILGVHASMVPRLAAAGDVVGRLTMGRQGIGGASRVWLLSRKSCLENAKTVRAAEANGTKVGRPRRKS